MSFGEAVRTVLGKYSEFSGRARRSEYWYWALAVFLASIVVDIIFDVSHPLGLLLDLVLFLGTIVPGLAVLMRRLHDTDRTGWWMLIGLIPLVGAIVLLVFVCQDSQPGVNQYGPSPKEAPAPAA